MVPRDWREVSLSGDESPCCTVAESPNYGASPKDHVAIPSNSLESITAVRFENLTFHLWRLSVNQRVNQEDHELQIAKYCRFPSAMSICTELASVDHLMLRQRILHGIITSGLVMSLSRRKQQTDNQESCGIRHQLNCIFWDRLTCACAPGSLYSFVPKSNLLFSAQLISSGQFALTDTLGRSWL
jgi:hypothetical protein